MSLSSEHVKFAIRIIDNHIDIESNIQVKDDDVALSSQRFNERYARRPSVPSYLEFDTCGDSGIPKLVQYFTFFDPVNAVGPFCVWTEYVIEPTYLELQHVYEYLIAPEFNKALLSTIKYDRVVHAIVSYILTWCDEGLLKFARLHNEFKHLVDLIMLEKNRTHVYVVLKDHIPFVRSTFRILTQFFKSNQPPIPPPERVLFSVKNKIPSQLITHFNQVYLKLLTETVTHSDICEIETSTLTPFQSTALEFSGIGNNVNIRPKVITGQACCGKTTLLNSLKAHGWSVCSRSFLGTFSGKSKSPAAILGLHAALENALCRGDVLGDRGAIDNPLWSIIMPLCNPTYKDCLVEELINFFNSTINEHVLTYMYNQDVVVFVDPYPSKNRARMMNRCVGGDAFRARIHMYPITQFMAYYMAARLFGWMVRCVPYDNRGDFHPQSYLAIANEIITLFGTPIPQRSLRMATKPIGPLLEDNEYSIATGIFK